MQGTRLSDIRVPPLQVAFAAILFTAFLCGAIFNAVSYWKIRVKHEKFPSIVALVPGIVGVASFCLSPFPALWRYCWLPLVIDPGCAFTIIFSLVGRKR